MWFVSVSQQLGSSFLLLLVVTLESCFLMLQNLHNYDPLPISSENVQCLSLSIQNLADYLVPAMASLLRRFPKLKALDIKYSLPKRTTTVSKIKLSLSLSLSLIYTCTCILYFVKVGTCLKSLLVPFIKSLLEILE